MALVNCKECNKEISDSAKQCPHCGYKKKKQSWFWPLMIVFLLLAYCSQDEIINKAQKKGDNIENKINNSSKSNKDKQTNSPQQVTLAYKGKVKSDPCSNNFIFELGKGETVTSINRKRVWYGISGVIVHTIDISKYNKGAKYGWISDQHLENATKPLIDKSKLGNKCLVEKLK